MSPDPRLFPLTFTQLYPNALQPNFGVFVENRLRHLTAGSEVVGRVLAPVPWFPSTHHRFGGYALQARVPREERRHGIPIAHPRYPMIPKIGMTAQPWLLYKAMVPHVAALLRAGTRIDLLDAHYVYPDGVAAALLARRFGLPLVMTARGTDLNLLPRHATVRRWIRFAIREAQAMIGVCAALADTFVTLGAAADRVHVLRNGVDLALFQPTDRRTTRNELGLDGPVLLFVGQLIPRKGVDLIVEAMAMLPEHTLLIAGSGPERASLERRARATDTAGRIRFLGEVPHDALPRLYGAADALVLPSEREGWANVLLESMACGTPVIASDIWGTPEIVTEPAAGQLMRERTAGSIVEAWHELCAAAVPRAATRAYAEGFGWDPTTRGQIAVFRCAVAMGRG